jgi:hypothetical protein
LSRLSHGAQPGDEDLSNLVALQTLATGGTVCAIAPEEMPNGAPFAALKAFLLAKEEDKTLIVSSS